MPKSSDTIREVLKGLAPEQKFFASIIDVGSPLTARVNEEIGEVYAELREAARDKAVAGVTVLILYDDASG